MNLAELELKLRGKVQTEYLNGFNHIYDERVRKRDIMEKVLDTRQVDGQVKANLLWQNIQLENALFLTDELGIKLLATEGITGEEQMKNAETVLKYDDLDMNLREQRENIVNYNALYWLAATIIDNWDEDEQQPMSDCINPLSLIIDPQNYSGSKARFIGVERRVNKDWLLSNPTYTVEGVTFATSEELDKTKRYEDEANNLVYIQTDDGFIDMYDHFCSYDGKVVLTTWLNGQSILIRYTEIRALTDAEKKNPMKVSFPIQLHRRKPKLGSPFGVSIADEVLQSQDNMSVLLTLENLQARNLALGPDVFMDERLGIDTETLAQRSPGGRIIPITNDTGLPTQNGVYTQQLPAPNPFISDMIGRLESRSEKTTNVSQQSFGVSQSGVQTKAEIQTLQQNANQILIWIANNYLQGQKEYWMCHYRSYCLYMGSKKKKSVAIFQKGTTTSLTLKREDFVSDGKVNIYITSKSQEEASNEKEFNKILALANLYLPNLKKGYSLNDFLRLLGRKSNIRDFDEYRYIAQSIDELEAMKNLPLLNKDIEVPGPADGQDYMTYILIYRQALDTKAKADVLGKYEQAYTTIQAPQEAEQAAMAGEQGTGQGNPQTANTALNNLNQNSNTSTGIATI